MRFYRLLLALFLIVFTGEFCKGQSWDWVAGTKSAYYHSTFVTENGETYLTHEKNAFFSTADTLEHNNETLTKIDRNGRRLCGISIGNNSTIIHNNSKHVYVHGNVVYLLITTEQDITIGSKFYPKPKDDLFLKKQNIILVKLDTNCVIKESIYLGWEKDGSIISLKVSPDNKIFVDLNYTDSLYLSGKHFVTNRFEEETILVTFDNNGNILWNETQLSYYGIFDINSNYWTRKHYPNQFIHKTRYVKINPDGKIIDSLIIEGKATHRIFIDNDENILLTGSVRGDITFQDGSKLTNTDDVGILIKYNKNHQLLWYKLSSGYETYFWALTTNKAGDIYLAGFQSSSGNRNFIFSGLKIDFYEAGYFIKLDKNGVGQSVEYAKVSGTATNAWELHKDDCDNIYMEGQIFAGNGWTQNNGFSLGKHFIPVYDKGNGSYLAKLNPDNLEFEPEYGCELITLKNTSDTTAYTSFEWTLPDGTKHFSRDAYIESNKYTDTVLISLKGIKPNGCENIFTRKLKFQPMPKPVAKFSIDSFSGCQWIGIKFYNQSYKIVNPACVDCEGFGWDFGDGIIIGDDGLDTVIRHIYTKPGTYKIRLIYGTLPCHDTFTLEKQITIIEAPKPGFTVNQTEGCAPLTVNITNQSIGEVENYFYTSGDGQNSNQSSPSFIYTKPGKYFITQNLKGPTECITKDSVQITIRAGYTHTTEPEILTATVTDSNFVKIHWKKNDVTANYKLIRQSVNGSKTYTLQSSDSFYLDKDVDVNKAFYRYTLYGTDSCESTIQAANVAQTILLENLSQTTEYNYLRWSPYQSWQHGVQEYNLQYNTDTQFIHLVNLSGDVKDYKDAQLYPSETKEICYRIIATENAGNNQQSQSNTVCMHFLPTIIVPNAFSPNNDGINDAFSFSAVGIENYRLTIYNRWGEKVYSGTQKEKGWDGKFKNTPAPEGVYLYKISAKPYTGKSIYQSGNLQLLR